MKPKFLSTIKFFIGWPLSLIALFFIGKLIFQNFRKVIPFLSHIDINLVLLSIAFFLFYFLVRSFFWHKILLFKGVKSNFIHTAYLWEISEIKRFIPGNVWAIAGRTTAFAKEDISKKSILKLWFLEMEFLVIGSLVASLFAIPFILNTFLPDNVTDTIFKISIYSIIILLVVIFLLSKYIIRLISHLKIAVVKHAFPPFTIVQNAILLISMTVAFLFFGIATFVGVYAIFPLPLHQLFMLSSFFVASFLIGYIAIISPMGLGIREAVMTAGLSKYVVLAEAGFGAIFTRIILIAAEIVFLLVILFLERVTRHVK